MSTIAFYEWAGSLTGLLGAALIAVRCRFSGYGFLFFLLSNFCWIAYGLSTGASGLILMQIGFTATSLLGVYRWLVTEKVGAGAPASTPAYAKTDSRNHSCGTG